MSPGAIETSQAQRPNPPCALTASTHSLRNSRLVRSWSVSWTPSNMRMRCSKTRRWAAIDRTAEPPQPLPYAPARESAECNPAGPKTADLIRLGTWDCRRFNPRRLIALIHHPPAESGH